MGDSKRMQQVREQWRRESKLRDAMRNAIAALEEVYPADIDEVGEAIEVLRAALEAPR